MSWWTTKVSYFITSNFLQLKWDEFFFYKSSSLKFIEELFNTCTIPCFKPKLIKNIHWRQKLFLELHKCWDIHLRLSYLFHQIDARSFVRTCKFCPALSDNNIVGMLCLTDFKHWNVIYFMNILLKNSGLSMVFVKRYFTICVSSNIPMAIFKLISDNLKEYL